MMKVPKTLETQSMRLSCLNLLCSYFEGPHSIGSCSDSKVSASEVELTGTGSNQIQFNSIPQGWSFLHMSNLWFASHMNPHYAPHRKKHYWGLPMLQGWWDGVVKSFKTKDHLGVWIWWPLVVCISWQYYNCLPNRIYKKYS